MDAGSFTDPNAVFVRNAARLFQNTMLDFLLILIRFIPGIRNILSWLRINTNKPRQTRFFRDIVRQAIRHRRESGQRRNDLIDLMIDAIKDKEKTMNNDNDLHHHEDQYEQDMRLKPDSDGGGKTAVKLDEDIVMATAMVILVAGYDATGMTLSYVAYYLAKYPAVQQQLQQELDEAFEAAGGQLPDYTVIQVYLKAFKKDKGTVEEKAKLLLLIGGKNFFNSLPRWTILIIVYQL